jgi:hypothetical protein
MIRLEVSLVCYYSALHSEYQHCSLHTFILYSLTSQRQCVRLSTTSQLTEVRYIDEACYQKRLI